MANKADVLRLLSKGLTPKEVAEILDCNPAYVRATRMRALVPGYSRRFMAYERGKRARMDKYRADPEFRKIHLERVRQSRVRAKQRRQQEARA